MAAIQSITIQDIKKRGSNVILDDQPSYLIVNSKIKSVIVPYEDYKLLIEALEELEDRAAIEDRRSEDTVDAKEVFDKLKS